MMALACKLLEKYIETVLYMTSLKMDKSTEPSEENPARNQSSTRRSSVSNWEKEPANWIPAFL